jgi:predicted kinase
VKPVLVYVYGPPASGKLTVAEKLAELSGYALFHNHLTVNAISPVLPFGCEAFSEVLHRLRLDVFGAAVTAGISLIFTNNSAWGGADARQRFAAFADQADQVVRDAGGRTFFVKLRAPLPVLEARVADESRRKHHKLLDRDSLRELVIDLDQSPLHPGDLFIDTASLEPDEAAKLIFGALQ